MSRLTAWIRSRHKNISRCNSTVEHEPPPPCQPPPQLPSVRDRERVHVDWSPLRNVSLVEYPDLATGNRETSRPAATLIFVTARFRSGSTLLWNILRHVPGMTSYYEPLHPTLQLRPEERVSAVDPTHVGVEEYWSEYDRIENLANCYTEPWHNRDLYLDALDWKPALERYLRLLIDSAPDRAVLQFNRVDFRLAWLRHVFPDAQIVHLFRHPRDQWLSVLRQPNQFGPDGTSQQFMQHDYFVLVEWVHDLSAQFPMLNWDLVEHPYAMHYLLWKLSFIWGRYHSDYSLSYEQLTTAPRRTLSELFEVVGLSRELVTEVVPLVRPGVLGKWRTYADAVWFAAQERHAETLLDSFLGSAPTADTRSAPRCLSAPEHGRHRDAAA